MAGVSPVKLFIGEFRWKLLMISQHWLMQWFGVVKQHAFNWANVYPDLWRHVASLDHTELIMLGHTQFIF